MISTDAGYTEIRNDWVPEGAYVNSEIYLSDEDCVILVYLDWESMVCVTLRFFPIAGSWQVSVENSISLERL